MSEPNNSTRLFLSAQLLSTVGDGCFHFGIVLLAFEFGGHSTVFVGLSQLMRTLPYFLAVFIAFYLIDHVKRGSVMRWSDLLRFSAILTIAILFDINGLETAVLFALLVVKSICDVHFLSARDSWITQVQQPENRIRLNTFVQAANNIGFASGLALGALVMSFNFDLFGLRPISLVLCFDALSYLLSFTLLSFTKNPPVPKSTSDVKNWRDMWKVLRRIPHLNTILWITALDNLFIMGPAFVATPMLLMHQMFEGSDEASLYFGYYEIWFALSMFLGAFLLFKKPPKRLLWSVSIGLTLDGLTHLPFVFCSQQSDFKLLLVFAALHAFCIPLLMVPRVTWIQHNVPAQYQGRVFALMAAMVLGVTGLSCFITGVLISEEYGIMSANESFYYLGIAAALVGVVSMWLFRNADSSDPEPENSPNRT